LNCSEIVSIGQFCKETPVCSIVQLVSVLLTFFSLEEMASDVFVKIVSIK